MELVFGVFVFGVGGYFGEVDGFGVGVVRGGFGGGFLSVVAGNGAAGCFKGLSGGRWTWWIRCVGEGDTTIGEMGHLIWLATMHKLVLPSDGLDEHRLSVLTWWRSSVVAVGELVLLSDV